MDPSHHDSIAQFKTLVWQNQAIAQRYQVNIYADSFVVTLKNIREIALAIEFAQGRVLDAGCGTGRFTIPLHDAGFDVTGLDVSNEMLDVGRQAAENRPIPFVQGSVFDLPYKQDSFDSIVSITVVPHFPQWVDIVKEYTRVVRPGGRLMFNMCSLPNVTLANRNGLRHGAQGHPGDANYFQAEVDLPEVIDTLASFGAVVTEIIPYDTFNHNYLLRESLGSKNEAVMAELEGVFREPGAIEFWDYIERTVLPFLPITASYGYMVIAELPSASHEPRPWTAPPRIELNGGRLDAAALRRVMGAARFQSFYEGLQEQLKPLGAIKLLSAFNELIGPHLPVPVDFLPLLSPFHQARVLDQVAWRWAQGWHKGLQPAAISYHGTALAPLMEYEVLNHFTKALKPLVGGNQ